MQCQVVRPLKDRHGWAPVCVHVRIYIHVCVCTWSPASCECLVSNPDKIMCCLLSLKIAEFCGTLCMDGTVYAFQSPYLNFLRNKISRILSAFLSVAVRVFVVSHVTLHSEVQLSQACTHHSTSCQRLTGCHCIECVIDVMHRRTWAWECGASVSALSC